MSRLINPIIRKPTQGATSPLKKRLGRAQHGVCTSRGQGMVEFALVLPLLLLLLFGIIELGRLMVIYTSVATASRDAARYASAAGDSTNCRDQDDNPIPRCKYYENIGGIRDAAQRFGILLVIPRDQINVNWDGGPDGWGPCANPNVLCQSIVLGDRVVVTVSADYDPLLGLTPLQPFTITSTTSRTIVKDVAISASNGGGGGGANEDPTVVITSPTDDPHVVLQSLTSTVTFNATASDPEDGPLTSNIVWLKDGSPYGGCSGGPCSISITDLPPGNHTITAQVTDQNNNSDSDSIRVYVNPPPVVNILTPTDQERFNEGEEINFTGEAHDQFDGDLSDQIQWSDNGVPLASNTASFSSSNLALGLHTITAQVSDAQGQTASASITVVITPDTAPLLVITSPPNGTRFALGSRIDFYGYANDAQDGNLSDRIFWRADDVLFGEGATASIATLSEGSHLIEASVGDLTIPPNIATATIAIYVQQNRAPDVRITSPGNGDTFPVRAAITFSATADDDIDGDLSSEIVWTLGNTGETRRGASFQISDLPVGTHTIIARATDRDGLYNEVSIVIEIINDPPVVTIDAPPDNTSVSTGTSINFRGTATDPNEGLISNLIEWSSSIDQDLLGTGASITTTLSAGTHTITASATDHDQATGSASIQLIVWQCPDSSTPIWTPWNNQQAASLQWALTGASRTQTYILDYLRIDMENTTATISSITVEGVSVPSAQIVVTNHSTTSRTVEVNGPINVGYPPADNTNNIDINFIFGTRPRRNESGPFNLMATIQSCSNKTAQTYPTYP